jgi:hypothetical protein
MAMFHLYAGYFGQPESQVFRTMHVAFVLAAIIGVPYWQSGSPTCIYLPSTRSSA